MQLDRYEKKRVNCGLKRKLMQREGEITDSGRTLSGQRFGFLFSFLKKS